MEGGVKSVTVLGERHDIIVYKHSGSLWFAAGNFMGKPLKVQGPTRTAAAKEWRDAARYNGLDSGELSPSFHPTPYILTGLTLLFATILFGLPILSRGTPF
jgi:hypothetical protein